MCISHTYTYADRYTHIRILTGWNTANPLRERNIYLQYYKYIEINIRSNTPPSQVFIKGILEQVRDALSIIVHISSHKQMNHIIVKSFGMRWKMVKRVFHARLQAYNITNDIYISRTELIPYVCSAVVLYGWIGYTQNIFSISIHLENDGVCCIFM